MRFSENLLKAYGLEINTKIFPIQVSMMHTIEYPIYYEKYQTNQLNK